MKRATFVFAVLISLVNMKSLGQNIPEKELSTPGANVTRTGYYYVARAYEVTMTIYIWGEVAMQGAFIVSTSTDLVQLLSYAGGPKERANIESIIIYRFSKADSSYAKTQLFVNLKDILEGGANVVQLHPGDMVVIKKLPEPWPWFDIVLSVNALTSLAVLIMTLLK
jgi:hypothetical protein